MLSAANALQAASCLLHGFSDSSRLAIVQHLLTGEHRVVELTEHLGLPQSTVSRHCLCLLNCGVLSVRVQGRSSVYSVAHPEATRELLMATEQMLALTSGAATSCPTSGIEAAS